MPPDDTVTMPPVTMVVPMAVPRLNTVSAPLDTVVLLAVPPASHDLGAGEDRRAARNAIVELPAAGDLRDIIGAMAADDLAAAAVDRGGIGEPSGQNIERAAARYRGVAGTGARRHDLGPAARYRRVARRAARGNNLLAALGDRCAAGDATGQNVENSAAKYESARIGLTGRDENHASSGDNVARTC
jgi:hypothetical protein